MPTSLQTILDQFREDARNNPDLGGRFERLIHRFLELDPLYKERFDKVWLWNDWPGKANVGDIGIDLVARDRADGEYCAIQCKFYLPEHSISKGDVDTFFTAAGDKRFTSCLFVSTTDKWNKNALHALHHQAKPVNRLSLSELKESPIDWSQFDARRPDALKLLPKKTLRPHQVEALKDVKQGLADADRGKLIMACGTGKTFTALKIAETLAPELAKANVSGGKSGGGGGGHVLFLVPSLSLLAQSLREWTTEAEYPFHALAVCSDVSIGTRRVKADDSGGDITQCDLAFPATTNAKELNAQYRSLTEGLASKASKSKGKPKDNQLTVVFSTYHSIEAIHKAQKKGLPDFDLIICDEAHRTTGVTLAGEDESHFVKVHDADYIKSAKRLYMTATPRIYGEDARQRANEAAAEIASMDDPAVFGEELHRLGFGDAVKHGLLTDYKVLVLAVDEDYVAKTFQKQLATHAELNLDDATRITGCWNGLEKKFNASSQSPDLQGDVNPMRRAVAFSRTIKDSKQFVEQFHAIVESYKEEHPDLDVLDVEANHVDGTFDALRRNGLLDWLKQDAPGNTARILSNARCLSEGVDVPALDAIMFLNPRNSQIDVVQSVGRVMRLAEGKRFGYIILPIGIPADKTPEEALRDNDKYKVVWQVLQALRAHDDRFNATINQIELNKNRPDNISVIGVGGGAGSDDGSKSDGDSKPTVRDVQGAFAFPQLEAWKDAIYAKMVKKCGDRAYWATWASDIARIAEKHITRIKALVKDKNAPYAKDFADFLAGLQNNLNPAVTSDEAVEMLAQHLITRPVFDALFAGYAFTEQNPVSQSMQQMLDKLDEQGISKEAETLDKFYASVRDRAAGLDNAEARQKVIIELYDEFFKNAFPDMHKRLGIVYTPVEVVDFIIHSVQDILKSEFDSALGDEDVHIIDPFTGTGTFIVRLLQSGLIDKKDLPRKFKEELHANEIVLLAYYIAAINIEETYHGLMSETENPSRDTPDPKPDYSPFDGIVLTDTFQMYESQHGEQTKFAGHFPENSKRAKRQQASPIRVVIANPPYNEGSDSALDGGNINYPALDKRLQETYGAASAARTRTNIYDSYIRALRWASERIKDCGVVGFVSNGSFIDGKAADGLRACLGDEFTTLYVFNLRGNQRTSGETSRREGGKIFGSGSRAPIAITLLVKNPAHKGKAKLCYHDIGDYLSRNEKLRIIREFVSIDGIGKVKKWVGINPNPEHDWINQRDPAFQEFIVAGDKSGKEKAVFTIFSDGAITNRDPWAYNSSSRLLESNIIVTTKFFTKELARYQKTEGDIDPKSFVTNDEKSIRWDDKFLNHLKRGNRLAYDGDNISEVMYRPFFKQQMYFDKDYIWSAYRMPSLFPINCKHKNIAIATSGVGKEFFALIVDSAIDRGMNAAGKCYPLYHYESNEEDGKLGFDDGEGEVIDGYRRRDAITDGMLKTFQDAYPAKGKLPGVSKEDIFYYVYGVLHSPEYRERFAADLKKMLPRIPLTTKTQDFWAFSKAGRDLAHWHLNYETIEPWPVVEHDKAPMTMEAEKRFKVKKMRFARPTKEQKDAGEKWDKTQIIYNDHITLSEIPLEAYDYVVNGKSAIEWVMERYQVTVDKKSQIRNDPNDWCKEHNNPRYIIDLITRLVTVSLKTNKIVRELPPLNEEARTILYQAQKMAEELMGKGWKQQDFANALKDLFEQEGGESNE